MFASHKHKFIFLAVTKTATHAIREALRRHTFEGDREQQGKNASKHPSFARYYDEELIESVGDFYTKDLQTFGYDFESATPIN